MSEPTDKQLEEVLAQMAAESGDFDWAGAPEGERWVRSHLRSGRPYYYVIVGDEVYMYRDFGWLCSDWDVDCFRDDPLATRVDEPARPVLGVGDRVRVTEIPRTWVGHVTRVEGDDLLLLDEHPDPFGLDRVAVEVLESADQPVRPAVQVGDRVRVTVEGVVRGYSTDGSFSVTTPRKGAPAMFWPPKDGAQVEVLEHADPPLKPGDLVRDKGTGFVYEYTDRDFPFLFAMPADHDNVGDGYGRADLTGPLVKVELREVGT